MSVCFIILNCFKYEEKRQRQLNTWLKDFPYPLWFHIRGVPDQAEDYIVNQTDHMITVRTLDNYESLARKTYLALKAVRESFPEVTHVIKTDDDENCNVPVLIKNLDKLTRSDYGGGYYTVYPEDRLSTYHYHSSVEKKPAIVKACGYFIGRFYFLSAAAIDIVLSKKDEIWDLMYEDNAIGYAVRSIPNSRRLRVPDRLLFTEF